MIFVTLSGENKIPMLGPNTSIHHFHNSYLYVRDTFKYCVFDTVNMLHCAVRHVVTAKATSLYVTLVCCFLHLPSALTRWKSAVFSSCTVAHYAPYLVPRARPLVEERSST